MSGNEIKAAFGRNIKNLRNYRNFSQADLSERADISIIYLSNIERGVKFPKPAVLSQIAEALEVEIFELFKFDHLPKAASKDNKKIIKLLSQEMTKKINLTMDGVFNRYLK